ncbi:MAG: hypothetical protein M1818_003273 [Claussenomyces sp. TS43310]|nr:MAG: hypothetical protein M1818_003273 [Claussenomyces sp. TS43310]
MSSRRHLVSRTSRVDETPARRGRQAEASAASPRSSDLPPYQPPAHPLTASHQRKLADISASRDYSKYKKHLEVAIKNITNCTAESNDRLYDAKQTWSKQMEKREAAGGDLQIGDAEERASQRVADLEDKVKLLTENAEKALRDLIDYRDEMAQQENMLRAVSDEAMTFAVSRLHTKRRGADGAGAAKKRHRAEVDDDSAADDGDSDADFEAEEDEVDNEEDPEAAAVHAAKLGPTQLLQKAKADYLATYTARTMRTRYAENNDYKGFKQVVHDAQHPGANAPPLPHARTWFASEEADTTAHPPATRHRRQAARTDHIGNDDDDDDIQFAGAVSDLKCPLTLQTFREPYSNRICNHTFEKSAIIAFHRENAAALPDASQGGRRGRQPQGPKVLRCPQHGCEAMLELKDFYDDQMILRQVKRAAAAQAAAEMEDDDMEENEESAEAEDDGVDVEDITAFTE